MSERQYYVLSGDNCRFPAMTKEQILSAIEEATGNVPQNIDNAFITKIRDMNSQADIRIWIGTSAEFNALTHIESNTMYIFSDDDTLDSILADIEALRSDSLSWGEALNNANTLTIADLGTNDYVLVKKYGYGKDKNIDKPVKSGLYMVRIMSVNLAASDKVETSLMMDIGDGATSSATFRGYNDNDLKDNVFVKATKDNDTGNFNLKLRYHQNGAYYDNNVSGKYEIRIRRIGGYYQ